MSSEKRTTLALDQMRYGGDKMPPMQKWYRKAQQTRFLPVKILYKALFAHYRDKQLTEMSVDLAIGEGLYLGHPSSITINPAAVLGRNVNLHKGVTIGQENRGSRQGTPVIGDEVWIGINATIVGAVTIGNDVLIAPNSYVNCDVPSHSVVFGNPCVIKHKENATADYINNKV